MNTLPNDYQNFIALSRYARWLPEKKRRETWEETVARYFDFMEEQIFDLRRHYFQDNIVVWTIWRVALACAAVGVTRCSSKAGAFSGITEMRVILSGLSFQAC